MKRQLLLGCGSSRVKLFNPQEPWEDLTTLDMEPSHKPDVIWDLNVRPLPFADNSFDEIHTYEVLEHLGCQGYAPGFFAEFQEYWRILKPDGYLCATVPAWDSFWAWGDPGHTRVINGGSLAFLGQDHYRQVGETPSTDYRGIYKGNLVRVMVAERQRTNDPNDHGLYFVLRAVKNG